MSQRKEPRTDPSSEPALRPITSTAKWYACHAIGRRTESRSVEACVSELIGVFGREANPNTLAFKNQVWSCSCEGVDADGVIPIDSYYLFHYYYDFNVIILLMIIMRI
jgi:hypothetical protein